MGTLNHVLEVAKISSGEYIVVAAGDDISNSTRVIVTITRVLDNAADIASFACEEILEDTREVVSNRSSVQSINDKLLRGSPEVMQIHGASACYKAEFLKSLPFSQGKILIEDYVFRIIAFWTGVKVGAFDDLVLQYRVHSGNVGPKAKRPSASKIHYENAICQHYRRLAEALHYLCAFGLEFSAKHEKCRASWHGIDENAKKYAEIRGAWPNITLRQRIFLIKSSQHFGNPRRDLLRAFGSMFYFSVSRLF